MNGLRKFRRNENGSGTVEFVMMVPLLIWCLLATVSYFHAYRSEAVAVKTTLTLADMLSRERASINGPYLNNMRDFVQFLTLSATTPDIRVTVFRWNPRRNRYEVRWSRRRGNQPTLRTSNLNDMAGILPVMTLSSERAILVETWSDYTPRYNYNLGLTDFDFVNRIVISPRNGQLCWNNDLNDDPATRRC
jgi:hypothetical protein